MELYSEKSFRAIPSCGTFLFPDLDDNRTCHRLAGFAVNQRHTLIVCYPGDRVQTRIRRLSTLQDR